MKPLHRRAEVLLDLAGIYAWIGARNVGASERFLLAVNSTFEQIRRNPSIGWKRPWKDEKLLGLRSWRVEGFTNFLVFYREEEASIEIYAVLRGARRFERVLRWR